MDRDLSQELFDLPLTTEYKVNLALAHEGIKGGQIKTKSASMCSNLVENVFPRLGLHETHAKTWSLSTNSYIWKIFFTKFEEDLEKKEDLFALGEKGIRAIGEFCKYPPYQIDKCVEASHRKIPRIRVVYFPEKNIWVDLRELYPFVYHKVFSPDCVESAVLNEKIDEAITRNFGLPGKMAYLVNKFGIRFGCKPERLRYLLNGQGVPAELFQSVEMIPVNLNINTKSVWVLKRRNEAIVYEAILRGTNRFVHGKQQSECIYDTVKVAYNKDIEYVKSLENLPLVRV